MKISEENKALILEAEKIFPEVWKWMQREANRDTSLEDVLYALGQLVKYSEFIREPWPYLKAVIKAKQKKDEVVEREEKYYKGKIKREEDIAKWINSFLGRMK